MKKRDSAWERCSPSGANSRSEPLPTPLEQSDVMLDPWTDLPAPRSTAVLRATPGPPVLPDLADLPPDAEP